MPKCNGKCVVTWSLNLIFCHWTEKRFRVPKVTEQHLIFPLEACGVPSKGPFLMLWYSTPMHHPIAQATLASCTKPWNEQKMVKYNNRVLTVERGSFTPLIYTTLVDGVLNRHDITEKNAKKRKEEYRHVLSHMRTRVRFSLLRSVLVAVRGERGKTQSAPKPFASIAFNLIPDALGYES